MKKFIITGLLPIAVVILILGGSASATIPAFPGAEGAGALALGGRGGTICEVVNLNDSGPGSLRSCVEMEGPRTVIFRVSGTIHLASRIDIRNPYITIAGQTAPGGGIQIRSELTGLLGIRTHDVVVRYLKLRQGRGGTYSSRGVIAVDDNSRNVVIDHNSFFWSLETMASHWGRSLNPARDITWQNNLFAESLRNHATHFNAGAGLEERTILMTNIDLHNNLFAHGSHRMPLLKIGSARFVNNIVYNWESWASRTVGGVHADWVSNLWKPGPSYKSSRGRQEIMAVRWAEEMTTPEGNINRNPSLYIEGNRGWQSGMDPDSDNWPYTREAGPSDNGNVIGPMPLEWRRVEPLPLVGVPIEVKHADSLEDHILPIVGASRRLDCAGNWVTSRDAADARIIEEYTLGTGNNQLTHETEVGGFPLIEQGTRCPDTSGDGIPDEWLIANNLDSGDGSVGSTIHGSGYSFLELYLNGMSVLDAMWAEPRSPGNVDVR